MVEYSGLVDRSFWVRHVMTVAVVYALFMFS